MWDIRQTPEFGKWFRNASELDKVAREDIYAVIRVLQEIGPQLGRPYVDSLSGSRHSNMKELRIQSKGRPFRIFFAFDPGRHAVLLIGGNKSNDTRFYRRMIPVADDIYNQYLADLEEE